METIKVTRSQQWMINALLELMKNKNYRDITIVDIVNKAELGRRTFYRYFKTKDELLMLYCDVLIQDFAKMILEKEETNLYTVSLSYFEFWNLHIEFLKLLGQSDMLYFIGDKLPELFAKTALMIKHVNKSDFDKVTREHLYSIYFNAGGYWSITKKWAEKQDRETPEEIARIISNLIFKQ